MAAPIPARQIEAAFFKSVCEGASGVRSRPGFLYQFFQFARMASDPLGLLPFIKREVAGVAVLSPSYS